MVEKFLSTKIAFLKEQSEKKNNVCSFFNQDLEQNKYLSNLK